MKKFIYSLVLLILSLVWAENPHNFSIEGTWKFRFSNDEKTCTLTGDKVVNNSDERDSFRIILIFSKYSYSGGRISGYEIVNSFQDSLEKQYQRNNISITKDLKFQQPPTYTYYPVIILTDFDGKILDYLTFSNKFYYKNPSEQICNNLLPDYKYAKQQMDFYDHMYYSTFSSDYRMNYLNEKQKWSTKFYSIEKELINNRYYPNDYKKINYELEETYYSPYYAKSTPSSPKLINSYIPSFNYSYESSNTSSNISSNKTRKTCTYCNGTGKDSYKEVVGEYSNNPSKPWCDICKEYTNRHYHKSCIICQGRGWIDM